MPPLGETGLAASQAAPGPQIALLLDRYEWHARELTRAFARFGARVVPLRLSSCSLDMRRPHGLAIPGFAARLPDLVLVRAVGLGSFEAITLRLGILHALVELNVPVANTPRAIERCVDKAATSFLCFKNGIPTPPTFALQSPRQARALVRRECANGPLVLKPLFGAQGRGLKLIRRESDLPDIETVAGVYYLQRFVGIDREGYRDIRVLVAQGRVLAAMTRRAEHWITNVKLGGKPEPIAIDQKMQDLALKAAASVEADFAGVDLLRGVDGGLTVIEVNSMPGWQGLQSVTDFPIAEELARVLLARYGIAPGPLAEVAS
jgi:tetrahydromethanopterin:alpha-L-glutamate ligase